MQLEVLREYKSKVKVETGILEGRDKEKEHPN